MGRLQTKKQTMRLVYLLCLGFLILSDLGYALDASYESSAVGRIVGDDPNELLEQFNQPDDLNLSHATYYSSDVSFRASTIADMIDQNFQSQKSVATGTGYWPQGGYDWVENELLVLEPFSSDSESACFFSSASEFGYYVEECKTPSQLNWGDAVTNTNPLIFFNGAYTGLYIPKTHDRENSFVGVLGQDSNMIAPTAISDSEFLKAWMCALVVYSVGSDEPSENKYSIGEVNMVARNSYYWRGERPSSVAYLSYGFYGLPYLKFSTPFPGFDRSIIDNCPQFFDYNLEGPIGSGNSFIQEKGFSTGEITITSDGNYSILTTNNTYLNYADGELLLPERVAISKFPLGTIVKNISLTTLGDPENHTILDLPMWYGNYSDRLVFNNNCSRHNQSAGIYYSHTFTEDSELVFVYIHPVEVVDCENGLFTVYRNISYQIVYEAFSPVFLDVVSSPSEAVSGENVSVSVRVDNLINVSSSGLLFLDSGGVRLFEGNISVDSGNSSYFNVSFIMPQNESLHVFTFGFSQGNGSLTNTSFVIRADSFKVSLASPSVIYESMGLDAFADVFNGWNVSLDSKVELFLSSLNGSKMVLADQRLDIPVNESVYSYPDVFWPAVGDYYVSLKVSSEISPGGELVSRPLHVESLGGLCSEQGNLSFNYSDGLNYSFAAYCMGNMIAVSINVTNNGSNNVSTVLSYSNSVIDSVRALNVYGIDGSSPTRVSPGVVSFNLSFPVNSSEYGFLAVDLNDPPVILSANHTPELSNGFSDLLFSVDWNDSGDDMSRLFVCKSGQLNESGCMDGVWCNTSLSYDTPLECDYLVYPVDEGVNDYYAYICDSFGACSDVFNSSFAVDAHAPNITVNSPSWGYVLPYASSVWVNISTDENASCRYNLSDSDFYYETGGVNFTETGGLVHGFALNVTGGQMYYLYYKCEDGAGNVNDVSTEHNFSVESSACSSGGVGICGEEFCCGAADNVCPAGFEGITCGVSDPDCAVCSYGGVAVCGVSYCCGVSDGVCPSEFGDVSCSTSDVDCV